MLILYCGFVSYLLMLYDLLFVHFDLLLLRLLVNSFLLKQHLIEIMTNGTIQQKKEVLLRKKKTINYISYKIYLNTLKKAFNQIKEMEKNAIFVQEDKGEFLEVKIVLPKKDRCFT